MRERARERERERESESENDGVLCVCVCVYVCVSFLCMYIYMQSRYRWKRCYVRSGRHFVNARRLSSKVLRCVCLYMYVSKYGIYPNTGKALRELEETELKSLEVSVSMCMYEVCLYLYMYVCNIYIFM